MPFTGPRRWACPIRNATGGSGRSGCMMRCEMHRTLCWRSGPPIPGDLPSFAMVRRAPLAPVPRAVLDAVRYHSVGLAEWDMVGRILYCADFLEPGRSFDRERRAELAERLPREPTIVLREVARSRLIHTVESGWPILEPTVRFWNSLVATGAASH